MKIPDVIPVYWCRNDGHKYPVNASQYSRIGYAREGEEISYSVLFKTQHTLGAYQCSSDSTIVTEIITLGRAQEKNRAKRNAGKNRTRLAR